LSGSADAAVGTPRTIEPLLGGKTYFNPNLPLLEDAVRKLAPFLDEIVFVGGVTLGLLITDEGSAPIRGTTDVDVIAEIVTYADYIAFSERLREAHFTEDTERFASSQRPSSRGQKWKPSRGEAAWTFKPATTLRILSPSSTGERLCCTR